MLPPAGGMEDRDMDMPALERQQMRLRNNSAGAGLPGALPALLFTAVCLALLALALVWPAPVLPDVGTLPVGP